MAKTRPNVLIIMTDQQRGDCLGIEGHPVLQTPHLDHLAATGTRFTRAYSTCPVCIPARRSLMSGQFPATHGMVGYKDNAEWDPPATLPGIFRDAGYHTAIVGRCMHLYPPRKRYGFDHMCVSHVGHGLVGDYEGWLAQQHPWGKDDIYGAGLFSSGWTARPWHLPEHLHPTNWTVDRAKDFLRTRDPSCPFFLVVSFLAPHPPLNPPDYFFNEYLRLPVHEPVIGDWATPPPQDGRGTRPESDRVNLTGEALRLCRAGYYGLISHVDSLVGSLFKSSFGGLTHEENENTIVVFTSDHGEMLGDHYLFRKQQPYEGSARIPLLVRGTRDMRLPEHHTSDLPVCLEDIMPTLAEMAGLEVPKSVEGRSLAAMTRGPVAREQWRSHLHGECAPRFGHYLTDGREKYIWHPTDGREQLFDLVADPGELQDLAAKPKSADRVAAWRNRLIAQLRDRPEGFTDGKQLSPGRPYNLMLR